MHKVVENIKEKLRQNRFKNFHIYASLSEGQKESLFSFTLEKNKNNIYSNSFQITKEGERIYHECWPLNGNYINELYSFYNEAASTIATYHLAIITTRIDGYLTISEEGFFKWVALDGKLYDDIDDFLGSQSLESVPLKERQNAIFQMMGKEKETSFEVGNYLLHMQNKNNNFIETIYKENVKVGEGILVKTPFGYRNLFTDTERILYADNLYEFSFLYEHFPLLKQQKRKKENHFTEKMHH